MRRPVSTALSLSIALAIIGVVPGGAVSSPAPTMSVSEPSNDVAARGSIAGARRVTPSSHLVVFVFSVKNKGLTTVDDVSLEYTSVRRGRVVDQLCVQHDEAGIDPDSPACEPGSLAPGQSDRMTLIVRPRTDLPGPYSLEVRVCASDLSGTPDVVPGNDCTTKSVLVG